MNRRPGQALSSSWKRRQEGAITILVVLVLLVVCSLMAMGLARESLRDSMITGNDSINRKAFEAADSGLDYVITWGSPYANPATSSTGAVLQQNMANLLNAIDLTGARTSTYMDSTGTLRFLMSAASTGGDLVADTSNYLQSSVVQPSFDLEMRYLGQVPLASTGSGSSTKSTEAFWLVNVTGRATVGSTGQSFLTRRETLVQYSN